MNKYLLLILTSLPIFISCNAQKEDLLSLPIYLEQEGTVDELLQTLEKMTDLLIAYPSNLVAEPEQLVKVKWEGITLSQAIKSLFPGKDLELKQINRSLIIKPQKKKQQFRLHGYTRDANSGEALIGATILLKPNIKASSITNQYGFYSLSLAPGDYLLEISYLGYEKQTIKIDHRQDKRMDFRLVENTKTLEMVIISDKVKETALHFPEKGETVIDLQQLKVRPSVTGEPDLIKVIQSLPGINTVGEGSGGMFVRGGNIDQNLILLDEAPIYNPNHLLGFFSIFHPDAIRYATIHKSNFPIQFGGRLSSVVDIHMREGNKEKVSLQGGIGMLTSSLLLEGPIKKGKHSFMLAARRSYPDLLLNLFTNDDGGNKLRFFDINAKLNFQLNPNNRLFISAYNGQDIFRYFDAYENRWGNSTATIRWNKIFSNRLFANFSAIYSQYDYNLTNFIPGTEAFNWASGVRDVNLKALFSFYLNPNNQFKAGFENIFHYFEPGKEPGNQIASVPESRTIEQTLFFGHHLNYKKWQIHYGFRLSAAHNHGKGIAFEFSEDFSISDTIYNEGVFHSKFNIAPRVFASYSPNESLKIQVGYNRTIQYIQELRNINTGFNAFYAFLPSSRNIPEQRAEQLSMGLSKTLQQRGIQFSLEIYYKWLNNQTDFIPHSILLQNPLVERDLRVGDGKAYGVELQIQKKGESFSGSLAYTYSRAFRTIADINNGNAYPAYYDQPHSVNFLVQYNTNKRWLLSLNWIYHSGSAVTLPIGSYQYEGRVVPIYGDRNSQRLPDYHRLDLSATLFRKKKERTKSESYWQFSVYNAYFRKNALAIDILPKKTPNTDNVPDPTDVAAFKTFLFSAVPSVAYHFKF